MDGGVFGLLGLIRDHRGAVEYDLSTRVPARCPKGLRSVGETITLPELVRLVTILRADPSSAIAAALEGWDHPVSREAAILMDLWDLEAAKGGARRPPTYPRVWKTKGDTRNYGDAAGRTREEVLALLGRSDPPV